MRILMLTHEFPPFRGGIATYASQLALAAHEIGHEVFVVAPDFGQDLRKSDEEEYPFQVERYHSSTYNFRKLPALLWRTWRQGSRTGFDLLHAVDPSYTMALAFINHFKRVPFVATAYGTEILSLRISRQARFLRTGDLFEKAAAVFAISEFTRSLLQQFCPLVETSRVHITPLGVDDYWFEPSLDETGTKQKIGVPEGHRVILTVARLDERKGHLTVLKAIAALKESMKERLSYLIVGRGSDSGYAATLHQLAQNCGVKVHFIDNASRERLRQIYSIADVFCMPGEAHPGKVEGFGLAYLEAAAQGVPSIGSRVGAIPEVVRHGETGLLIDPGDVAHLTQYLELLLTDTAKCRGMGDAARVWAKRFTWRRCAELTYGALESRQDVARSDSIGH